MRTRLLVTNGIKTVDLFWLLYENGEVYCGPIGSKYKRTYHKSGKVHSYMDHIRHDEGWHHPIINFKDSFQLLCISLNPKNFIECNTRSNLIYKGKKSDFIINIDGRSFNYNETISISVALLEPHRYDILKQIQSMGQVLQINLRTDIVPWICVTVHRI